MYNGRRCFGLIVYDMLVFSFAVGLGVCSVLDICVLGFGTPVFCALILVICLKLISLFGLFSLVD